MTRVPHLWRTSSLTDTGFSGPKGHVDQNTAIMRRCWSMDEGHPLGLARSSDLDCKPVSGCAKSRLHCSSSKKASGPYVRASCALPRRGPAVSTLRALGASHMKADIVAVAHLPSQWHTYRAKRAAGPQKSRLSGASVPGMDAPAPFAAVVAPSSLAIAAVPMPLDDAFVAYIMARVC